MLKWNPKNRSQKYICTRTLRGAPKALKTFSAAVWRECGRRGGMRWKFLLLKGGKQHFHHFPAATDTYIWSSRFPPSHPLGVYIFAPAVVLLLPFRCRGAFEGLCTKCHARSWSCILGISSACMFMYIKHKNLWKRWQHHPIFCVYGTFLPPQLTLTPLHLLFSFFGIFCSLLFICRNQTLVKL